MLTLSTMTAAGGDERLVAALENLTLQNQALMNMMTTQTAAASANATSVSSMASLARSIDTKGMLKLDPVLRREREVRTVEDNVLQCDRNRGQ